MASASTESDGWGTAAKVFDGSETSMWHTQGDGPQTHWIKVNFILWLISDGYLWGFSGYYLRYWIYWVSFDIWDFYREFYVTFGLA